MKTIEWTGDALILLDQTKLPCEEKYVHCTDWRQVAEAITMLRVRGAPAIGVAAAYAMVLAAREALEKEASLEGAISCLHEYSAALNATRPTAVNLKWALDEVHQVIGSFSAAPPTQGKTLIDAIEARAKSIEQEDIELTQKIAAAGESLFPENKKYRILTHCNTGSLATAGIGTALGVIRNLHSKDKIEMVYADETRPLLQGARLTAFELVEENIPATLLTDNMAAYAMQQGLVDAVIVGADRITTEGDVANKIGTYGVAVLAKAHEIPFYVAAPFSTFDFSMAKGSDIPIEMRDPNEVRTLQGVPTAPSNVQVLNPAFDVTPHELISAIITEEGILQDDYIASIQMLKKIVEEKGNERSSKAI